jgi:hypothetical protein
MYYKTHIGALLIPQDKLANVVKMLTECEEVEADWQCDKELLGDDWNNEYRRQLSFTLTPMEKLPPKKMDYDTHKAMVIATATKEI